MSYQNFRHQKGATLFVGLMFLLVLTLVALISMQGTTLELKMATNQSQRQSAFELSESMRAMAGEITTQNQQNRGMQTFSGLGSAWANTTSSTGPVGGQPGGGTSCLASTMPVALELYQNETATSYSTTWHTINGVFRGNVPTGAAADIAGNPDKILADCNTTGGGSAWANVYSIGTRSTDGSGAAANESQLGVGLPAGGAAKWYEIRSQAQIGNGAVVVTAGERRVLIQN